MGSKYFIKKFSKNWQVLEIEVKLIPFNQLPLYINHKEPYVKYIAKRRLKGSNPITLLSFLRKKNLCRA